MSTRRRGLWGTRFGFYLAAIGSAFGLGNLWRFPYITAENGGGAFVLLYILLALLIGLPLLIGELMLGKLTRRGVVCAMQITKGPVWMGILAVLASLLVLSYYAVISGWVLHFFMQFLMGQWLQGMDPSQSLTVLRENGLLQVALTSVHLLITIIIVIKGVQEGIERWVGNVMPIFVILLIVLVTKSLSMSTASDAMRFLFYPDFSKLTTTSLIQALGHVCFTLSIGFGTMVTFGSYLNENTRLPGAGFRVTGMDTTISLFAGLLIFPIVMATGFHVSGPEVLFLTLPQLFVRMEGGLFFGLAFFLCLYLAALGASIGLLEAIVSNIIDDSKRGRRLATWLTGAGAFALALFPALSSSVFRNVQVGGRGVLELLDVVIISGLLPFVALGIGITVFRKLKIDDMKAEFVNDDSLTTARLFGHWRFVLRWIVPTVVGVAWLLALVGWLLKP